MAEDNMMDFDILAPPKRTAKIGGEIIDVTIVPARAAFKFITFSKKYNVNALEKSTSSGSYDPEMITAILDVIELICKRSSKKITADWLQDNVDITVLMKFVMYVFEGIKGKGDAVKEVAGDSGKN